MESGTDFFVCLLRDAIHFCRVFRQYFGRMPYLPWVGTGEMYIFHLVGSGVFVDVRGKPAVDVGGICILGFDVDWRLVAVLRRSVDCSGGCVCQLVDDCMPYAGYSVVR